MLNKVINKRQTTAGTHTTKLRASAFCAAIAVAAGVSAFVLSTHFAQAAGGNLQASQMHLHETAIQLPDLSFYDVGNRQYFLHDFKGKVLVVNFWATWCPPCVHELPTLDALQATMGGDDLQVIALSVDRGGARQAAEYLSRRGLAHLHPYGDRRSQFLQAVNPGSAKLPTTLIIDGQGREVARYIGMADWNSPAMQSRLRGFIAAGKTEPAAAQAAAQ
jgi:thiol-disulfide isomerase/thioredoxin